MIKNQLSEQEFQKVKTLPLCIDLDGTLIQTDMLYECFLFAIKTNVFQIFQMAYWFARGGRPRLKKELAERYADKINYKSLPYQMDLINWLEKEKKKRKEIVLVTGSYRLLAENIASELGLFHAVYATDLGRNLTGEIKAKFLRSLYPKGYLYAGNEAKDIKVWSVFGYAIFVNVSVRVKKKAQLLGIISIESFGGNNTLKHKKY